MSRGVRDAIGQILVGRYWRYPVDPGSPLLHAEDGHPEAVGQRAETGLASSVTMTFLAGGSPRPHLPQDAQDVAADDQADLVVRVVVLDQPADDVPEAFGRVLQAIDVSDLLVLHVGVRL